MFLVRGVTFIFKEYKTIEICYVLLESLKIALGNAVMLFKHNYIAGTDTENADLKEANLRMYLIIYIFPMAYSNDLNE